MDLAKRSLLRGGNAAVELRPPWLHSPASFTEECTRCQQCIDSCPEAILRAGDGGFPVVDFSRGECTFCGDCTKHCEAHLFDRPVDSGRGGWTHTAGVDDKCLTHYGVMCRSCEDSCEPAAISFPLSLGKIPSPAINERSCTGCGACIAVCPQAAISMTSRGPTDNA